MRKFIFLGGYLLLLLCPGMTKAMGIKDSIFKLDVNKHYLIITDQSRNRIAIVDVKSSKIVWQWHAKPPDIRPQDVKWFKAPSDAKAVLGDKYILMTASLGGVALIRIADKKTIFYTYVGGNTHSAELLPDGNIVTASSTGNYLTIIHTDTTGYPDSVYKKKIYLPFAHNVVWDRKRQLLWSASNNKLYALKYNFNCRHPDLTRMDSINIPGRDAHDLFPVYGMALLWLTTPEEVFTFNPSTQQISPVNGRFTRNIKDVSSGPVKGKYPTIIMLPREKWWTDEVLDMQGNVVFEKQGLRMYKARWLLPDTFSYEPHASFKICQ